MVTYFFRIWYIYAYTLKADSLYSTVDGSQQGLFWLVGEKKIKDKICLHVHVGGKKKIKGEFHQFHWFFEVLASFFTLKVYDFRTDLWHVGGENKIKANLSIFFLVGPIFSSSEESSTVEYSECKWEWPSPRVFFNGMASLIQQNIESWLTLPQAFPSRHFWDRHRWKSGLSIVIWDCGRWKSGLCLLGL